MNIADFLAEKKVHFDRILHTETHDAQRLAAAVHTPAREVAKTVLLRANGGYTYVVAVLPADKAVDLEKAAETLGGSKLVLATEAEIVQHCRDCEVGALPPFGSLYGMRTVVDESITQDDTIVFEGDTRYAS